MPRGFHAAASAPTTSVRGTGALAHADGRFARLIAGFAKTDLIILDDWGLAKLSAKQCRDVLELHDGRHGTRSTTVSNTLPVGHWHEIIAAPPPLTPF